MNQLNVNELNVGDAVGFVGHHDYMTGTSTVSHITAKRSVITLADGKRFNQHCRQLDREGRKESYHGLQLVTAERANEVSARREAKRARTGKLTRFSEAMSTIIGHHKNGYGEMLSDFTDEEKAQLIALIQDM